jgi:hypothetical protein
VIVDGLQKVFPGMTVQPTEGPTPTPATDGTGPAPAPDSAAPAPAPAAGGTP